MSSRFAPVPTRCWSSHRSISLKPLRSSSSRRRGSPSSDFFDGKGLQCVQPKKHQFRMNLANVRERCARTKASTSMILAPRCQSWRDTRFWPRCMRLVGTIGIAEFQPQPAAGTGEDARRMRPQFRTRQQVTGALAVIGHSDRNIDPHPIERTRQCFDDIAVEGDLVQVAVKENRNPAIAEPVEANRPAAGPRAHFGRVGTIAIGIKV